MLATTKKTAVSTSPKRASSMVNTTQITVLTSKNGMRRPARSLIAPSWGETTKMIA